MLKIRLQRKGRKMEPHYRVVVMESTRARDSKYIVDLGYYNPHTHPSTLVLNKELAKEWLANGAKPSATIAQFFVKEGLLKNWKETVRSKQAKSKTKKKAGEEVAQKAEPQHKEEVKKEEHIDEKSPTSNDESKVEKPEVQVTEEHKTEEKTVKKEA